MATITRMIAQSHSHPDIMTRTRLFANTNTNTTSADISHGPNSTDNTLSGLGHHSRSISQPYTSRDDYEDYIYQNDSQSGTDPDSLPLRDISNRSLANNKSSQHEIAYLQPPQFPNLNHKASDISSTGTPDSLLDFYGQESGGIGDMTYTNLQPVQSIENDQERWIHRDKLAQIESKELQAAGFVVPGQRTKLAREQKKNADYDSTTTNIHTLRNESHQPPHLDPHTNSSSAEDNSDEGDRPVEEVAVLPHDGSISKGSSRIPLSKNSRLPIPLDYISRDTPVPRRKSNGWNNEEDSIAYPRTRDRSRSTTRMTAEPITTDESSLPKQVKQPSPSRKADIRNVTSPSTRKSSQSTTKKRAGSGARDLSRPNNVSRDVTPSVSTSTSSASNKRPEGDPPWLATMYKPDPRLPPDQQMLPTVAKRLQQEAWEKEGKFGNAYDSSFRPMNNDSPLRENSTRDPSPELGITASDLNERIEGNSREDDKVAGWPLPAGDKVVATPERSTPGTPGGGNSYSTMPRIQTQPHPPSLKSPPLRSPVIARDNPVVAMPQPLRMDDDKGQSSTKEAKKRSCGCCVVM